MTFRSEVPLREPLETSKEPPAVQAVGAKNTIYTACTASGSFKENKFPEIAYSIYRFRIG